MNKKNVIAITGYNNPALLYIYLETLCSNEEIFKYKIMIFTEVGYDPEENSVVDNFKDKGLDIELIVRDKHPTCPLTGFHNILTAYCLAADQAKDFVIFGEEDILPTKDYLSFNEEVYKQFLSRYDKIFCAAHKRRPETELEGNPELLIGDYQCTSPSCVSVKSINKYLRPLLVENLFNNPIDFYSTYFNSSRIGPFEHTHHDGFIERVMEKYHLFSLKPDSARSMHVGLDGIFSRGEAPVGTLEEKIAQWKYLIENPEILKSKSHINGNVSVVPFDSQKWDNLHLDLDRDKSKASSWHYDGNNEFKNYILNN